MGQWQEAPGPGPEPGPRRLVGHGKEFLEHLMEAREIIEPIAAELAAQRSDRADVRRMRQALSGLVGTTGDSRTRVLAEIDFHEALIESSHNPVLAALHQRIGQLGYLGLRTAFRADGAVERAAFWHRRILDAIEARDRDAAGDAMLLHVRQTRADISVAQELGLLPVLIRSDHSQPPGPFGHFGPPGPAPA